MNKKRLKQLEELDKLFTSYLEVDDKVFSSYHKNKKQENKRTMTTKEKLELKLLNNQIQNQIGTYKKTLKDVLSMIKTYKGDDSNTVEAVSEVIIQMIQERINELNKLKQQINQIK